MREEREEQRHEALSKAPEKLYYADELCELGGTCDGAFCKDCLSEYIKSTLKDAQYMVPKIRCPGCFGRIRSDTYELWHPG